MLIDANAALAAALANKVLASGACPPVNLPKMSPMVPAAPESKLPTFLSPDIRFLRFVMCKKIQCNFLITFCSRLRRGDPRYIKKFS